MVVSFVRGLALFFLVGFIFSEAHALNSFEVSVQEGNGEASSPGHVFTFEVLEDGALRLDKSVSERDQALLAPKEVAPKEMIPDSAFSPAAAFEGGGLQNEIAYDVPIEFNKMVIDYIHFFQTKMRDRFETWLARSGRYVPLMQEILRKEQLPEDLVFLVLIESGFEPKALSRAKAAGQWQFIKGTGRRYGLQIDQWIDERRDPVKSTVAAAQYLKYLYEMFGSWPLSMASYNAGEGKIMRALARSNAESFWDLNATGHIRPETKNYVPKFMAATIIAKDPKRYGFFVDYHHPLLYDEVEVPRATSLKLIAKAARVPVEAVKALNPELKKEITPPHYLRSRYLLKLPVGKREVFLSNFFTGRREEASVGGNRMHRVVRGQTISSISRMYDVRIESLLKANKLRRKSMIRVGRFLIIPSEPAKKKV